jgi:hypothetical protein
MCALQPWRSLNASLVWDVINRYHARTVALLANAPKDN